jgi:hypothetical protein
VPGFRSRPAAYITLDGKGIMGGMPAPLGVYVGPLLIWALGVFLVAYVVGRLARSSALAMAIWIGGLCLPLYWAFISLGVACVASIATGGAYWTYRKRIRSLKGSGRVASD